MESLLPPVVVFTLGYLTRKILLSLVAGILVAGIQIQGGLLDGVVFSLQRLWSTLELERILAGQFDEAWNILICTFLLMLGVVINLLHHSGAASAYAEKVRGFLGSPRQAETSSLLLSTALFIDDYFSTLTVGSVMKPITDSFRIARAKLAFLVDSMGAPLTMICPISSWVAATIGFLRDSGVSPQLTADTKIVASPYLVYLNIIPYVLYSLVAIAGSWLIVRFRLSFGRMAEHERIAAETGHLFGPSPAPAQRMDSDDSVGGRGRLLDFVVLIASLVAAIFFGLLHSGDYYLFGGANDFAEALRYSSAPHGLFRGGVVVLGVGLLWMLGRRLISPAQLPSIVVQGAGLMWTSVTVLMLAWTLGDMLSNDLHTGDYLAAMFAGQFSAGWLPVSFFLVSAVTSVCIGSSWGTAAIMFPIAIQMYLAISGLQLPVPLDQIGFLFPVLGAVLSGCVAGDHVSPISDTTIMSAVSTGMDHTDHVETQMGYALPMIGITAAGFLGLGHLWFLGGSWALAGAYAICAVLIVAGVVSLKLSAPRS